MLKPISSLLVPAFALLNLTCAARSNSKGEL
jgi:hypothetical protein